MSFNQLGLEHEKAYNVHARSVSYDCNSDTKIQITVTFMQETDVYTSLHEDSTK